MDRVLRRIAKKFRLNSTVKRYVEEVCQFYARLRVKERLDAFEGEFEFYETLKSGLLDIGTEFPENDAKALQELVLMVLKLKVVIAEIGSWKGRSTSVLAKCVVSHGGSLYAVDHWMGSEGVPHHECAKTVDIFSLFKRNMMALGVWDIIHPLVMDSQTASQIFADGLLDLVFIDADHRYEYVKKDILSWLPKVRHGGILCGHDCEGYYSQYPEEIRKVIDEHLNEDYISRIHAGVVKALHERFQDRYSIMPNSTIWYYVKE